MQAFLCATCGTQYAPSDAAPERCLICDDERQYVPAGGQRWTTLPALQRSHMATFRYEAGVLGIGTAPASASASGRCCCARRRATCCGTASA